MDYNPGEIEARWKKFWKENDTYKVSNDSDKPKYYVLDMFPYPSGAGLHVGHPLGYIASDIFARYKVQKGFNVLHPMGYDAFGLPAEQYAIQTGVHPAKSTDHNIAQYRKQLDNIGFNYDWSRAVKTSDPNYYKWTQWIFIKLFDHYYDTTLDKAQPVTKLIADLEAGGSDGVTAVNSQSETFSADEWQQMTAKEKDDILMNYRLAYRKLSYVNWCEELGTVLANDEVKDGVSERGGYPVEKRAMRQWSLRITAYAERLLSSLEALEWSDALKASQRNWIGKSTGARVYFAIDQHDHNIEIFTTRPDTIYGATFMVMAPEHDLVDEITTASQKEAVDNYKKYVDSRSERERMADVNTVTGADTGAKAVHPLTGDLVPIYISEYVLADYGTGAIMAVPSDDDRDQRFAQHFGLPIIPVVDKTAYPDASTHDKVGTIINSDLINGLEVKDAIAKMINILEEKGIGSGQVNYRLRDANYSRQRYWGEPFPIYYDEDGVAHTDDVANLPIELPDLEDFKPAAGGQSPLARVTDWVHPRPGITRETDTMPGFAGSSWYFLRYMDADNPDAFAGEQALDYWENVDLYVGGTEHAVGHLMYSRFWHKFLYDLGQVKSTEPFKRLVNQGMIQGVIEYIYLQKDREDGVSRFYSADLAEQMTSTEFAKIPVHIDNVSDYGSDDSHKNLEDIKAFIKWRPEYKQAKFNSKEGIFQNGLFSSKEGGQDMIFKTKSEVGKMSKRYYNVVNPDTVVEAYGADCFRMYEMFLGPIEQSKPWDINGIEGVSKFLRKFWSLYVSNDETIVVDEPASKDELKLLHTVIKKVNDDIQKFSFNTCISAFMVCVNELRKQKCHKREVLKPLVQLIAPFAPFMAEELYHRLGHADSIHHSTYPQHDEQYLKSDEQIYPVCINGKKREELAVASGTPNAEVEAAVLAMQTVQKWMDGKPAKRVIVVPGRMINIVI
jgi:leucyl-tRNA synthetase